MRNIKKSVTVTNINVFKPNVKTLALEPVGSFEVLGGLGERLARSRAQREYGRECVVIVNNTTRTFTMDADTFFKYAHEVTDACTDCDASNDCDGCDDNGAYGDSADVD